MQNLRCRVVFAIYMERKQRQVQRVSNADEKHIEFWNISKKFIIFTTRGVLSQTKCWRRYLWWLYISYNCRGYATYGKVWMNEYAYNIQNTSLTSIIIYEWIPDIHMKQFVHNWNLPCSQCTEICSHILSIQKIIYTPVPCVSSSVENRSCPETAQCCPRCVI